MVAVVDRHRGGDFFVDRAPQIVAECGERVDGITHGRGRGGGRFAVPEKKLMRSVPTATLPRAAQCAELLLL